MGIKAKLIALLTGRARNDYNEIEILFYKDCIRDGRHGLAVVSNKTLRLHRVAVPFFFPGLDQPPVLTARLMHDITSAAESQGYVFHYLVPEAYGTLTTTEQDEVDAAADAWYEMAQAGGRTPAPDIFGKETDYKPFPHPDYAARRETKIPAVKRRPQPNRSFGESELRPNSPSVSLGQTAREMVDAYDEQRGERQTARILAGVGTHDIDTYLTRWWKDNNRMAIRATLTLDQHASVRELLEDKVAQGFMVREIVGTLDQELDEILDTYLKGIGRTVMSGRGKVLMGVGAMPPVAFEKLKEGSTLEQIQLMESFIEKYFPKEEFDALTDQQKEEIQMRVLLTVNNHTSRGASDGVVLSNVKTTISNFRKENVVGAGALKFPRQEQ